MDEARRKGWVQHVRQRNADPVLREIAQRAIPLLERRIEREFGIAVDMGIESEFTITPSKSYRHEIERRYGKVVDPFFLPMATKAKATGYQPSRDKLAPDTSAFFPNSPYICYSYREGLNDAEHVACELVFSHQSLKDTPLRPKGRLYYLASAVEGARNYLERAMVGKDEGSFEKPTDQEIAILRREKPDKTRGSSGKPPPSPFDIILKHTKSVNYSSLFKQHYSILTQGMHVNVGFRKKSSTPDNFTLPRDYMARMCKGGCYANYLAQKLIHRSQGDYNRCFFTFGGHPHTLVTVRGNRLHTAMAGADADPYMALMVNLVGAYHSLSCIKRQATEDEYCPKLGQVAHSQRDAKEIFASSDLFTKVLNEIDEQDHTLGEQLRKHVLSQSQKAGRT